MNRFINRIIAAFAMALTLTMAVCAYSDDVNRNLSENLIRLHIIADSDKEEDQAVKLDVRDAILSEMGEKFKKGDLENSRESIIDSLDEIEKISNRVLRDKGFTYTAHAQYGKFPFPTKRYSDIALPAGEYYGVRVTLGSGGGHNWWCVLYPPLCPTETGVELSGKGKEMLKDCLDDNSYDIIQSSENVTVKFKTVEICQRVKAYLRQRQECAG